MKNTKKCPKCSSEEIYSNATISKSGERSIIPVSSWRSIHINSYACMDCGFIEEYLDIKDKEAIEKLKKLWKKVD